MPQFAYVARDAMGMTVQGQVNAPTVSEVARQLRGEGKYPVSVKPATHASRATSAKSSGVFHEKTRRYRSDDVIHFAGQLSVMVDTGVALTEALEACRSRTNSPAFSVTLDQVIDRVKSGSEFSAALSEHPRVFSPLFVSLVRASEASGTLGIMLQRVAEFLENQRDLKKKILGAVTYPLAMLGFAVAVTVFLLAYVLPRFSAIYAGRESSLPMITRALIHFAQGLSSYGVFVLIALAGAAAGAVYYLRRPQGREQVDRLKLRLPLFGSMFRQAYLTRSLRTLGTLIESGVTLLEAVELTRNACGNGSFEKLFDQAREELQQGMQFSEVLAHSALIPQPIVQMIRAGERSGQLGMVLGRVAAHCESELSSTVKTATSMIEPVIIIVLGSVVGSLVIALLLPIFTISRAVHP